MKICLDTTPVTQKPSGVGLYILNLINELIQQKIDKDIEMSLVYQPKFANWLRGSWQFPDQLQPYVQKQILPIPVRLSNLLTRPPTGLTGKLLANYLGSPDIVHGTNYSVHPLSHSARIMTIYDVSFVLYPEYATSVSKAYFNAVKKCLKWTDLIITISESSKRDIVNCFQVPERIVWVTPLASRYPMMINTAEQIVSSKTRLHAFCKQGVSRNFDFEKPYLLFVGTLEPRKNITAIVQAFNQLKSEQKIEHQLLLVGRKGWLYGPILEDINQSPYQGSIHQLDYVSESLMADLYRSATAFVYPSHYEGFGLPVLEAMSLGCPVVSSNTSSIPEVAGNAAILVPPDDTDALADALYQLIDMPSLRQHYVQAGYEQAEKFSWKKTAQSTIEAYYSLMS
ncbi:glycosyltransferase [Leptolyngbya sp. PCC 7375]|nr:glycosyltransferase [Leptolyngbya sp. PCC 7375]